MRCSGCGRGMEDEAGDDCWRCREISVAGEAPISLAERREARGTTTTPETQTKPAESDTAAWIEKLRRIVNDARENR